MASIGAVQQREIIDRIRQLIALLGLTQGAFASKLGISSANMSKHLNGQLPITQGLVNRICLDLGVSRAWLLEGVDLPFGKDLGREERTGGIPVFDIDVTAGFGSLDLCFTEEHVVGAIDIPGLVQRENERIVRVSGDSMEPKIANGSYIAIREVPADTILWGQTYVVIMEDYRMVKTVRRHPQQEKIILHSENPKYDDIDINRSEIIGMYKVDAIINLITA